MSGNLAESSEFNATLGIFYMPQIYDMGQTALLPLWRTEGSRAEDFFALKNPTASAEFEPPNLGTKGQHATTEVPYTHMLASQFNLTQYSPIPLLITQYIQHSKQLYMYVFCITVCFTDYQLNYLNDTV
jgi:hypothetical protein